MNNIENIKQLINQIQAELNTDVNDVNAKMQVAEQLEELNKELAEYMDKLQDEIFDENMNSQDTVDTVETIDPFDFTKYDWFDKWGDNCVVGANYVKAVIEATSKVSNVSTEEIVAMTMKAKTFDDLVEISDTNDICLNDFIYYATYEFLPKTYANILSAVGDIIDITTETQRDYFVINFLTALQNIIHVNITQPDLVRAITENILVDEYLATYKDTEPDIVKIEDNGIAMRVLQKPDESIELKG